MPSPTSRGRALVALLLASACKLEPSAPPAASAGPPLARAAAPDTLSLPSREELPTTSGNIVIENLEGDLSTGELLLAQQPNNVGVMGKLVPALLLHARTAGRLKEYDRALELAEKLTRIDPKSKAAWLLMAQVHTTLHRFRDAMNDLKRAEKLGATGMPLDTARATLLQGMGRLAEARPLVEKWAAERPRADTVGALAALEVEEGHFEEAERRFVDAQQKIDNVSPYPLVWLWLQRGLMWQKRGSLTRARALFEAAHERLPADAVVLSHLAAVEASMGERKRSIERLRPLVASSDDPEYAGQLAELLKTEGAAEADTLRVRAGQRYDELLKQHPAAFAEHAARFWLGPGEDPKRALPLARANLEQRKTNDAYTVALQAALAAGEPAPSCRLAELAVSPPMIPSANLRIQASRAFAACGDKRRAEAELSAASSQRAGL